MKSNFKRLEKRCENTHYIVHIHTYKLGVLRVVLPGLRSDFKVTEEALDPTKRKPRKILRIHHMTMCTALQKRRRTTLRTQRINSTPTATGSQGEWNTTLQNTHRYNV